MARESHAEREPKLPSIGEKPTIMPIFTQALLILLANCGLASAHLLPPVDTVGSESETRAAGAGPPPKVVPCEKPVARAEVEFPTELLNFDAQQPSFKMHSGYINVTAEDYLFYWHFAAQAEDTPTADAPIVLWVRETPKS